MPIILEHIWQTEGSAASVAAPGSATGPGVVSAADMVISIHSVPVRDPGPDTSPARREPVMKQERRVGRLPMQTPN